MAYASITKPSLQFNTKLYTGNGGTNTITGVGFQPDLIWGKDRNGDRHFWADAVRGKNGTGYSLLCSNNNEADTGNYPPDGITAIGTDGFTLGANSSNSNGGWSNEINQNSGPYVSWNWKAGTGAGSANTDGSINTISTSVNTTAGFSISKYTGTGANATIGHGLGTVPQVYILKRLSGGAGTWLMYHHSLGIGYHMGLNNTTAQNTNDATFANSTAPTNQVVSVGTWGDLNANGSSFVMYAFAEKKGYSKFGSYTGNGNVDGSFVYTGFKPAFVMSKCTSHAGEDWNINDNKRPGYNVIQNALLPNSSAAEVTASYQAVDTLSNGFKWRGTNDRVNASGKTYIYMAFAEEPLVANVGQGIPATAR